jgi:hypothetical protein
MLKRLAIAALFLPGFSMLWGATYYVSPIGNDSNPGSQSAPWRRIQQSANMVAPGDTVLVQPGIYDERIILSTSGTPTSRITFKANGAVTNHYIWKIYGANLTIDGFEMDGQSTMTTNNSDWIADRLYIFYFAGSPLVSNVSVINCFIHGTTNTQHAKVGDQPLVGIGAFEMDCFGAYPFPLNGPQNCVISNNIVSNVWSEVFNLQGQGNLVVSNWVHGTHSHDFCHPFGANQTIRGNYGEEIQALSSTPDDLESDHCDLFQVFGNAGTGTNIIIEDNVFWNKTYQFPGRDPCTVGMWQQYGGVCTNIIYRNNLFNGFATGTCDINGIKFYNNTFYHCAFVGGNAMLNYAFADPTIEAGGNGGAAYGGVVESNAFVECGGWYTEVTVGYNLAYLTATNTGGGSRTGQGQARYFLDNNTVPGSDVWDIWGTCTNTSGTVTNLELYQYSSPSMVLTNFPVSTTFSNSFVVPLSGMGGLTLNQIFGLINANDVGVRLDTTTFPNGEISGQMLPYFPSPPPDLVSNYNFTCGIGGATVAGFTETTGVNGGAPKFVSPGANDFHLLSGSSMIAGGQGAYPYDGTASPVAPSFVLSPQNFTNCTGGRANFSALVGGTLPIGYQWRFNGSDIASATNSSYFKNNLLVGDSGSYSIVASNAIGVSTSSVAMLQVNTNGGLVLRYDFDESFSGGRVIDVSGNGNDGWQMDATNWITATTGVLGATGAQFTIVGVMTNDPPHVYPLSQYIAVTNINGLSYLTNGTISLWAKFDKNNDAGIQLISGGYPFTVANNPLLAYNSWILGRIGTEGILGFSVCPVNLSGNASVVVTWPDDSVNPNGGSPDLSSAAFHLYSVTIDCPGDQVIAYHDGQPCQTNTIGLPWIRVYGCASQPWLCIGADAHDGTPQWGDDMYPNSGFFVGKMDDMRIYNRTLAASEVRSLYAGFGVPKRVGSPPGFRIVRVGP